MLPREGTQGGLNIALSLGAWSLAAGCLWLAAHANGPLPRALAVLGFALVNNTIFALLHESVHRAFHPRALVNDAFGVVSGAFFPLGLSLQRVFHLGHHQRNRTQYETFDYYFPDDSRLLKRVQWYGILSGSYWLVALLASCVYFFVPAIARSRLVRKPAATWLEHTSATAFLRTLDDVPALRARLELLFALGFQLALFRLLALDLGSWLMCYGAFALSWSGLQYADHAFSPLDVREGAWDLRVPRVLAFVLLNYHLHRAHHLHPGTSWLQLPQHVDHTQPRPQLFAIYARMWLGPQPSPGPAARMPGETPTGAATCTG